MSTTLPHDFQTDSKTKFPEDVYRREFKKLRHAVLAFDRLSQSTQEWAAEADLKFIERPSADSPGSLELIGRIDSLPPIEQWWFQASDAFANLRSALDQLNHNVYKYVSGEEPPRTRFPITARGGDWRKWRKDADRAGFPTWLIARYKAFQPYSNGRTMLATLETITNQEKHRQGVAAALSLASADLLEGEMMVRPMLPEDFDASQIVADFPPLVEINAREFHVFTLSIPGHSIEIQEAQRPANFRFDFVFKVDGLEIPLDEAVMAITGEALWAACHVVGREASGTKRPSHLDLSLSEDGAEER